MLATRLISAAILGPLIIAVVLLGEPWLSILVGVVAFLALIEVIALLDAGGFEPPQVLGIVAGIAVFAAVLVSANRDSVGGLLADLLVATQPPGLPAVVIAAAVLLLGIVGFTRSDPRAGFVTWSVTTFGVVYVGLLTPFLAIAAHLGPGDGSASTAVGALGLRAGAAWAITLLIVVWGYDTGAFAAGRWLGRRHLLETISPSKTVEGVLGGLVLATIAAVIGAWLIGLAPWHPLVIGPLVGLAAQAGDLAESMLKRAACRKDSGDLIPGHGGILDRLDSFLFAAPVLVGYAMLVAGFRA
ncbi:MAG: phosphatidate cytidylyltransferase [Chloroflexota bacterium]